MQSNFLSLLLICYGCFLILCGLVSVIFIGPKAKTALISGGASGAFALFIAWLASEHNEMAPGAGILLTAALVAVFSWRSTKTLYKLFALIPEGSPELKGKGIAFLVISLMAVVSVVVLILQVVISQ